MILATGRWGTGRRSQSVQSAKWANGRDVHGSHLGDGGEDEEVPDPDNEVAPDQAGRAAINESKAACPVSIAHEPSASEPDRSLSKTWVLNCERREDLHQGDLPGAHERAGEAKGRDEAEVSL